MRVEGSRMWRDGRQKEGEEKRGDDVEEMKR